MATKKVDASKLVFKKDYQKAGKIEILVNGRFYPTTKQNIIKTVELGVNKWDLSRFFTEDSIKKALANNSKTKKEDGENTK